MFGAGTNFYARSVGLRGMVGVAGNERVIKALVANGFPVIVSQWVSATDPIRHLTPFVEHMGTWGPGSQKEFWWEREWRYVGELNLWPIRDKVLWFCPENDISEIEQLIRGQWGMHAPERIFCIDPRWGLEQIIGALMDLPTGDLTPFGVTY